MAQSASGLGGLKYYDPSKRARAPEWNVFLALVAIVVIFEALGWLLYGDSFLFNTRDNVDTLFNIQRLQVIILQSPERSPVRNRQILPRL